MTIQDELHRLIDGLDGIEANQQLHLLINEMDETVALKTLVRIRRVQRGFLEAQGFVL